jgi:xylulokinase
MLLGIDVGTSRVKAALFDAGGRPVGFGCSRSYSFYAPKPGWSQMDPVLWWDGILEAVKNACGEARRRPADIGAVGLSVLFPSFVPMDAEGKALYPAILYNDQRSGAQVRDILRCVPRREYQAVIGNVLVPGNCAVSGIAWLRAEEPEVYRRAVTIGFTNTFVLSRFTGAVSTDTTMASVSGLADIRSPWRWSDALCERLSIDRERLPRIQGPAEIAGGVSEEAAAQTGLRAGTPVVCGCGDAVASGFGAGFLKKGTAVYTSGSTDCVVVSTAAPSDDRLWVKFGFEPHESWGAIGTSTSSGASIEWFRNSVLFAGENRRADGPDVKGQGESCNDQYKEITGLAASCEAGCGGLIFVPYLQGERTPVWDPDERGMFAGLTPRASLASLARAVLEGTAFALRHIVESIDNVSPVPVREIRAVGGGTKNDLWNRIKADVLQVPLEVLEFQETGTLGAALLAGVGAGYYRTYDEASSAAHGVNTTRRVDPDPGKKDLYDELFSIYKKIHPHLKGISRSLTRFDAEGRRQESPNPARGVRAFHASKKSSRTTKKIR